MPILPRWPLSLVLVERAIGGGPACGRTLLASASGEAADWGPVCAEREKCVAPRGLGKVVAIPISRHRAHHWFPFYLRGLLRLLQFLRVDFPAETAV